MAYYDVYRLTQDVDFQGRVTATYATETLETEGAENPSAWAAEHVWDTAAQPGFGDAYASAVAGGVENPGADPAVISDAQLLSAVQSIMAADAPPAQ